MLGLPGLVSALLGVALLLGACRAEPDRVVTEQAARICTAVQALREAPNEHKRPYLLALEHLPCNTVELCSLRTVCLDGYRRYLGALDALRAVRHTLAMGQQDSTTVELLKQAEDGLHKAQAALFYCQQQEQAIARQHRL